MKKIIKEKIINYISAITVFILIVTCSIGIAYFLTFILAILLPIFHINSQCGIEANYNSKLCQYLWKIIPVCISALLSIIYLSTRKFKNKNEPFIENLASILRAPKKDKSVTNHKKPFWAGCIIGFLLSILLSIGFALASSLFMTSAKNGMNFAQMQRMGSENMKYFLIVYGVLIVITIVVTILKRYPKSTIIFLAIYWVLTFALFRSVNPSCNEAETIKNVKLASHPVLIYDQEGLIGHGSGFAINDIQQGLILTNYHVIEGRNQIKVWIGFDEKEEMDATVFASYPNQDIALIRVNFDFPYKITLKDSDLLEDAETLYAIGWANEPNGEATTTKGILSRRMKEGDFELIQTDTPINPGNSGGPLVNKCGVVGMNTAKSVWSDGSTPTEGIGYALSSNFIQSIIYKTK